MEDIQVQETNTGTVETEPQVQESQPKMVQMTQEALDELISKRLSRQEKKLNEQFEKRLSEMSEAQKLSAMNEQQKAEYQAQKEREAFEAERKSFYAERDAFNKQLYKLEIQKQLNEAGLPDISDTLVGLEAEVVKAQIDTMKQSFEAHVNASIQAKIQNSASTPTVPQKEAQLLTIEQIQSLSVEEYNANKDLVQKSLQAMKK
jgi:hypothetical protein